MNPYRAHIAPPVAPPIPAVKVYTRGPELLAYVKPAFQALAWFGFVALVVMRFAP